MKKVSDLTYKNAKPAEKNYKIFDGGGLYLLIKTNGSKLWQMKYSYGGKEKTLSIGPYPLVTTTEARDARDGAKKLLRVAIDPSADKQERRLRATRETVETFKAVALEWHNITKSKWSVTHAADVLLKLERDVFPVIGPFSIDKMDVPDVLAPIRLIEARKAYESAHRVRQIIGQVLRYGIATGKCKRDIASDVRDALHPKLKVKHFSCLPLGEVPDFLKDLSANKGRLFPVSLKAIELLMLTFVRTTELIGATWEEFDLDAGLWSIPANRMKMKRPHLVPLSTQSLRVLRELKETNAHLSTQFILPSPIKANKSISNNTILKGLKSMGYNKRQTGHGFRALAMTITKENLGYRHEVIDRQLAHAHENQVTAAYDRAEFLSQRKEMMQEYADFLDSLTTGSIAYLKKAA